ncbi:MAG: carbon-nitrogen family hydrolase [Archaeoglobaceae archaeon]|nr:carbon-nitrogen family hydrolase [Archaeoglobaceae archaeon]MCX8152100.1 carbon-nitrogen family hydrolase [Archaeoglobaceae archaeon]MDW8013535.1 nitrilase-related carbon-nitrogen hydrolase [Archaeoglobaceae archaeon]
MICRVCVVQQKILPDRNKNITNSLNLVKKAIKLKADIVVLPEVHTTGFYHKNLERVEKLNNELKSLIELSKDTLIVAGVAERDNYLYNSAVLIWKGEIVGKYRKNILFPLSDEKKFFKAGNKLEVFETDFGRIGVIICYEIRFPELSRKLTKMGAEMIIVPAEFPKDRIEHWKTLIKARAIENQLFVIGANCVDGNMECGGRSMIVDPMGKVLAEAGELQEVVVSDVDLKEIEKVRKEFPFLKELCEF